MTAPRRYRALGGAATWRRPGLLGGGAVTAAVAGEFTLAVVLVGVWLLLELVDAAVVFEVSSRGLARGLAIRGVIVGHGRVLSWDEVEEIFTRWRRPGDFSVLETVVVATHGEPLTFGTRMGLGPYWALLSNVSGHAPHARRTGLTDEVLAETPSTMASMSPRRRAVIVAGGVLLAVWALLILVA
jgi:hypothetical protein